MPTLQELLADVDDARDEIVSLAQALVRIPTVNTGVMPTGNETEAAELLRNTLEAEGIPAEVIESAPGRGNLVARWRGQGIGPSLMFMGHLDVVPVEDESLWTHPPFAAEIAEGRIWGRGAADMKGTVAAEVMALVLLKRRNIAPLGDFVLVAAADEEAGGAYGFGWLAQHRQDLLQADFAINEGGGHPIIHNGRMTYPIPTGEKGRLEVMITVSGRGYHASAPWMADNAIYGARLVLDRISHYRPEVSVDALLFRHIGPALGIDEPITPQSLDRILSDVSARDPMAGSWLRAASRMTIAATMIHGGVKSNSIAETCRITCDVRTLPWQDEAYVARELDKMLEGLDNVRYEIATTASPSASPYQTPFTERIMAATRAALGRADLAFVPGLTIGFTDSRFVRPLGTLAYGFTPCHPDSDPSLEGAHNVNESISIEDVLVRTRTFVALAWDLASRSEAGGKG
jgi:acetylornithine deacetylase/succinyl-diaminopimelate desuccinylase-like protein